jgi:ABC-type Fe3+-siderophore transport system permease subunit
MFFHRHSDEDVRKKGIVNALGAFTYVAAIVLFIASLQNPNTPDPPEFQILVPIGFLMLFVLSAAVMGMLIFGAPVMLYIDGKKKEAVKLLAWTVGSLAAITVCMLLAVMFVSFRSF